MEAIRYLHSQSLIRHIDQYRFAHRKLRFPICEHIGYWSDYGFPSISTITTYCKCCWRCLAISTVCLFHDLSYLMLLLYFYPTICTEGKQTSAIADRRSTAGRDLKYHHSYCVVRMGSQGRCKRPTIYHATLSSSLAGSGLLSAWKL